MGRFGSRKCRSGRRPAPTGGRCGSSARPRPHATRAPRRPSDGRRAARTSSYRPRGSRRPGRTRREASKPWPPPPAARRAADGRWARTAGSGPPRGGKSIDLVRHGTERLESSQDGPERGPSPLGAKIRLFSLGAVREACRYTSAGRSGRNGLTWQTAALASIRPGSRHVRHRSSRSRGLGHSPPTWTVDSSRRGADARKVTVTIGLGPELLRPQRARRSSRSGRSTATRRPRDVRRVRAALQRRAHDALTGFGTPTWAARHPHAHRRTRLPRRHDQPPPPDGLRPARLDPQQRPDRDDRRHLARRARHPRRRVLARPNPTRSRSGSSAGQGAPAPRSRAHACSRSRSSSAPCRCPHPRRLADEPAGVDDAPARVRHRQGLLFLAFMADPRRQFIPLQRRLARATGCTGTPAHVGSATFAIPPGAEPPGRSSRNHFLYAQSIRVPTQVTHFSDPGCPWAWSASPAIAAVKWRYGDQLEWRDVMIGLTETAPSTRSAATRPPARRAGTARSAERGMPFATEPRETRPRHVADVPGRRRHAPPRPRARVRGVPRAAVRAVHDDALPRGTPNSRKRSAGSRASTPTRSSPPPTTRRPRRCSPDRDLARTRGQLPHRVPEQARQHRRPRALHGAEHQVHQRPGRDARGRRLPVLRGLRRADRQPRPASPAARPRPTPPRS